MSEIGDELARVGGAFEQPTLGLLHQTQARTVVAVFRACFGRDAPAIPTARLHTMVEHHLDELRAAGTPDVPTGTGREVCRRWMSRSWLARGLLDDGTEVYTLTSHAQDALQLVSSLTRERSALSEHRIATILDTARTFNAGANPSRTARAEILNSRIAALVDERDRLLSGEEMPQVSEDFMLDGYLNLLNLVSALPSDFARVRESFVRLRAEIIESFRGEGAAAGQVVDAYITQVDQLVTATPEGRAFQGAFTLLRDTEMLAQLRQDTNDLLEHPLADQILADGDRRDLRSTVAVIRRGLDEVIAARTRVARTLREYIQTHNAARDRELDQTLRNLQGELQTWLGTTGPRAVVSMGLLPERVEVEHLRERFHNPARDTTPPPLRDVSDQRPDAPDAAALRAQGGPSISELRRALAALPAGATFSAGAVFNELAEQLRRPVEVLGVLHLAANDLGLQVEDDATETYRTIRPDGSTRDLLVPRVTTPTDASTQETTP